MLSIMPQLLQSITTTAQNTTLSTWMMIPGMALALKGSPGPRSLLGVDSALQMPPLHLKSTVWQPTIRALEFTCRLALTRQAKQEKKTTSAAMA